MKELSLHILDIVQNSVSAGGKNIGITLTDSAGRDLVEVVISDDGCGMDAEFLERVTDPFTTTRTTRKVGMGIPLFKLAAEMAGGSFAIESAPGEGTTVRAEFQRSHLDRPPVGDMAGTLVTLIQGAPDLNFTYRRITDRGSFLFSAEEVREALGGVSLSEPEVLAWVREYAMENEAAL